MEGEGTYKWPNGDLYKGTWVKGKRNGRGVFCFKKNWKYSGTFVDDQPDGFGRLEENGVLFYEGNFKAGAQHGQGTAYGMENGQVVILRGTWDKGVYTPSHEHSGQ